MQTFSPWENGWDVICFLRLPCWFVCSCSAMKQTYPPWTEDTIRGPRSLFLLLTYTNIIEGLTAMQWYFTATNATARCYVCTRQCCAPTPKNFFERYWPWNSTNLQNLKFRFQILLIAVYSLAHYYYIHQTSSQPGSRPGLLMHTNAKARISLDWLSPLSPCISSLTVLGIATQYKWK